MKSLCLSCHGHAWVNGHFERLENTIRTTNGMTLTATKILLSAWEKKAAKGGYRYLFKDPDESTQECLARHGLEGDLPGLTVFNIASGTST